MVRLIPDEGSVVRPGAEPYDYKGQFVRDLEFVVRGELHRLTLPFGALDGDFESLKGRILDDKG